MWYSVFCGTITIDEDVSRDICEEMTSGNICSEMKNGNECAKIYVRKHM